MKEVGELLGAGELRLSQIHSRAVKHLRAAKAGGAPYRPLPRSIRALFSDNLWCSPSRESGSMADWCV
jgi:hypothetical protein